MSNIDLVRMGIKNLWRRKLRTFLTVLGVMIGTSSIVVMLSLGFGLSESFTEQISQWGSLTTINVYKRWQDPSMPKQKESKLDETAVLAFKAIPNVEAVSPTLETYGTIKTGRYVANVPIKGIVPEAMEAFGFEVQEGRLLNDNDELTILFGGGMSNNFYDPKSRVWREPKIDLMKDRFTFTFDQDMGYNYGGGMGNEKPNYKEYKIKVAGVLTEGNWETNYGVYMPLREVQKLMVEKAKAEDPKSRPSKETEYEQINVKVNDMKNVQAVQDAIKDIKRLFLLESTMIGIIGGVFGVALSYILSFFVNKFSGVFGDFLGTGGESKISIIPIWLIFAATAFSALIGILSGYFPAKRAMNLSALEAIRTE